MKIYDANGRERAEKALSIVMAKWGKEAIAERNALQSEVKALREELSQLKDDMSNQCPPSTLQPDPDNAEFIVASYFGERHFRIPQNADRTRTMLVKWGQLHYWSNDGDNEKADPIFDDIDSDEFDKSPLSEYWVSRQQYIDYAGPESDGDEDWSHERLRFEDEYPEMVELDEPPEGNVCKEMALKSILATQWRYNMST